MAFITASFRSPQRRFATTIVAAPCPRVLSICAKFEGGDSQRGLRIGGAAHVANLQDLPVRAGHDAECGRITAAGAVSASRNFGRSDLLANRFIRTAVAFFVLGVGLGMYMGITHDFRFTHVHVHINLLGWVALALAGLMYVVFPRLQQSWLAHAHYWLHTVGVAVFMGGFAWGSATGVFRFAPVAAGSTMVAAGVVLFAVNVFARLQTGGPNDAR